MVSAVYRMDEIIEVVNRDPKNIADAVDCMEQRLHFRSAIVKQKTLRLMKHIGVHGSGEFRRGLLRLSPVVRDLTHFTCPPDPFKGDIPWKRVQEGAREVMKVIHDDGGMSSHRVAEGYGRGGILDAPSRGGGVGGGLDMVVGSLMMSGSSSMAGDRSFLGGSSYARPRIDGHMPGSGADDAQKRHHHRSVEEKLVHAFCTPKHQGMRIAPSTEDCKAFRLEIAGKDGTSLAVQLEKEIRQGDWKECLRALCVLDCMCEHQQNSTESALVDYFKSNTDALKMAENSAQDRVRAKAVSVMSRIGTTAVVQQLVDEGSDLLSTQPDDGVNNSTSLEHDIDSLSLLCEHQQEAPNSPVAGLIFSEGQGSEGRGGDPFGDWEAVTSPPETKPTHVFSCTEAVDPFEGMFGGTENIETTKDTSDDPPPPPSMLDDFFASIPDQKTHATFDPAPIVGMSLTGIQSPPCDVVGAHHATTSGFTGSQAREESAFNFIQSTVDHARKK